MSTITFESQLAHLNQVMQETEDLGLQILVHSESDELNELELAITRELDAFVRFRQSLKGCDEEEMRNACDEFLNMAETAQTLRECLLF